MILRVRAMPWGIRPAAVIRRSVEPSFRRFATTSTIWFAISGSGSGVGDERNAAGWVAVDDGMGADVGVATIVGSTGGAGRSG